MSTKTADVSSGRHDLKSVLAEFRVDADSRIAPRLQKTLYLARRLQQRASLLQTPQERRQLAELDRMMQNPTDKGTLMLMTDQAFRSAAPHRAVDQLVHVLDVQGIPRFFSPVERTLLKGFQSFGGYLPGVAVPLIKQNMRKETANVILPAEEDILVAHLRKRNEGALRMNVNFLGEALLGEDEAQRRLDGYLRALANPDIEVISVKISTIYSQISALAREHSIAILCDRLEQLYRTAMAHTFRRPDGQLVPKFVYLDMEEYRDMSITADAFMLTLQRDGLQQANAGIALQAYIPDSFQVQKTLASWARRRVAAGGAPITVRIVKGANLEMERVDASLHGWPQAPYRIKCDTDANYKRMVNHALDADNASAMRVGIASHNLFELAYGLVVAEEAGALDRVQFEMLEGMANNQRRALNELFDDVLLYAPASTREDFIHAIGYLIRRLDENTGPDNFLSHAFRLDVDGPDWRRLEARFLESCRKIDTVSTTPRRTQDRSRPVPMPDMPDEWRHFRNEPDTDFSLPHNTAWARDIVSAWRPRHGDRAAEIALVIAGEETRGSEAVRIRHDPSRPGVVVRRSQQAGSGEIETALATAAEDADGWRDLPEASRYDILGCVARELRHARADLMGLALAEGGKTLQESDPEVSEAIDFVEFYRRSARSLFRLPGADAAGRGVVVVVSPWNFPIAIPCGGVAAALAAGNTVILKPASDTVAVAYELCQCFWRGGVSRRTLQFLPCAGETSGARLVGDPRVAAVILTGGTGTARRMLQATPDMHLLAETGGKDATIVTALSDRELAIKHVIHSAFSHAGQKCSATSLLILEDEVYDETAFRRALCDAVQSIPCGSAWQLETWMGPLIRPPSDELLQAMENLEDGESWAVAPQRDPDNPNLVRPAVKWGVQPGSFTHMNELFGPVLGVMRAKNLDHAIDLVHQTGFGLTSGLESLDDREQAIWQQRMRAGNLYINRSTTGAIVLRQPFGGMGKSAFGPGIKAGGPNYVAQLMHFAEVHRVPTGGDISDPLLSSLRKALENLDTRQGDVSGAEIRRVIGAIDSYEANWLEEFGRDHDHFRLVGQDNIRRYLTVGEVRIRVQPGDAFFDVFARVCAARRAGCRITVSTLPNQPVPHVDLLDSLTASWAGAVEFIEESDKELANCIRAGATARVRYSGRSEIPGVVRATVADTGICLVDAPVLAAGRVELMWYVREQSVCVDYHRYGNLGPRADEPRAEVL